LLILEHVDTKYLATRETHFITPIKVYENVLDKKQIVSDNFARIPSITGTRLALSILSRRRDGDVEVDE
jgi:hypothetical protein